MYRRDVKESYFEVVSNAVVKRGKAFCENSRNANDWVQSLSEKEFERDLI